MDFFKKVLYVIGIPVIYLNISDNNYEMMRFINLFKFKILLDSLLLVMPYHLERWLKPLMKVMLREPF